MAWAQVWTVDHASLLCRSISTISEWHKSQLLWTSAAILILIEGSLADALDVVLLLDGWIDNILTVNTAIVKNVLNFDRASNTLLYPICLKEVFLKPFLTTIVCV